MQSQYKINRHRSASDRACPRCTQNDKILLYAIVQCPRITDLWVYVEHGFGSHLISPQSFDRERQAIYSCLMAVSKEEVWWIYLKGLKADTFLFGQTRVPFFKFHFWKGRCGWKRKDFPLANCLKSEWMLQEWLSWKNRFWSSTCNKEERRAALPLLIRHPWHFCVCPREPLKLLFHP